MELQYFPLSARHWKTDLAHLQNYLKKYLKVSNALFVGIVDKSLDSRGQESIERAISRDSGPLLQERCRNRKRRRWSKSRKSDETFCSVL